MILGVTNTNNSLLSSVLECPLEQETYAGQIGKERHFVYAIAKVGFINTAQYDGFTIIDPDIGSHFPGINFSIPVWSWLPTASLFIARSMMILPLGVICGVTSKVSVASLNSIFVPVFALLV